MIHITHAVDPETDGQPQARRRTSTIFKDLQWLRRVRLCETCGQTFHTGELPEALIEELVELRHFKAGIPIDNEIQNNKWLSKGTISRGMAQAFVAETAWWRAHPSGRTIRAPGHAARIYKCRVDGWSVAFGANIFLVEDALRTCRDIVLETYSDLKAGKKVSASLEARIMETIAGCVSNTRSQYYGYYGYDSEGHMRFGVQSINVKDAAKFIIERSGLIKWIKT